MSDGVQVWGGWCPISVRVQVRVDGCQFADHDPPPTDSDRQNLNLGLESCEDLIPIKLHEHWVSASSGQTSESTLYKVSMAVSKSRQEGYLQRITAELPSNQRFSPFFDLATPAVLIMIHCTEGLRAGPSGSAGLTSPRRRSLPRFLLRK